MQLDTKVKQDEPTVDHKAEALLEQLQSQQQEIQRQMDAIKAGSKPSSLDPMDPSLATVLGARGPKTDQEMLMEQIRTTLAPKESEVDTNKAILRALITAQNKTSGAGGTSTLKPDIMNKLVGEREFSMAEWLASLNRQEEGESEINKIFSRVDDEVDCRGDCRHSKMRSGMLDKSTTNIRHKEVWPQKNLSRTGQKRKWNLSNSGLSTW